MQLKNVYMYFAMESMMLYHLNSRSADYLCLLTGIYITSVCTGEKAQQSTDTCTCSTFLCPVPLLHD